MDLQGKSVLFITHEDSLTGAPIAMLGNLKLVRQHYNIDVDICILYPNGGLRLEFEKQARKILTPAKRTSIPKRLLNKAFSTDINRTSFISSLSGYDVVLLSSAVSLAYFERSELKKLNHLVLFLYEMPVSMWEILGDNTENLQEIDLVYVPSEMLAVTLRLDPNVKAPINVLNQYIDPADFKKLNLQDEILNTSRAFTIGMVGTPVWPKAFEYFLCIAKLFSQLHPALNVQFLWKGIQPHSIHHRIYSSEIAKSGLTGYVKLEGKTTFVDDFYLGIDVLAITSREDTYPNVMLEAALFNVPTLCWKNSGGAESFVNEYGGIAISYLDLLAYVNALKLYYEDRDILVRDGKRANKLAIAKHCNRLVISEQLVGGLVAL